MATKSINNTRAVTTLASGITNSATSLTSTDNATTAGFPAAPFTIHIGTEVILVTSVGAGTNWTIQRGYDGTLGAAHDPPAEIAFAVVAEDFAFRYDTTTAKYVAQAPISGIDLNHLDDVSVPTPAEGQALVWDSGLGEWQAQDQSGGGGSPWNLQVNLPLTSLTDWTAGSGTWSIDTYIKVARASTAQHRLGYDIPLPIYSAVMVEVEMEVPSTGWTNSGQHVRVGIGPTDLAETDTQWFVMNCGIRGDGMAYVERDGTAAVGWEAFTLTGGTWVKVRYVQFGGAVDMWIDDVYAIGAHGNMGDFGSESYAPYLALYSNTVGTETRFRNLKVWTFSASTPDPDVGAKEIVFTRDALTVSSGTFEFPMKDSTVIDVRVRLRDAPTGSSVIFDVNKNGTTIFTTQGNRPTVPVASNTDVAIPDVTSFVSGDYLTVDIDQIDSNSVGAGAVLVVRFLEV